ncbi:putative hydro-lyase [Desulfatitalea alkaliphila]|uniref:Hydro-lyase n=1 Tax=Desulfatitalea alkaliphila TaxID=2929485 RepID=A0AA41R5M9_9BACT|nr:putative hydro-lyase [Desulfatitalea alkaliphila]MCJ8501520.1 putative hydro-lyase [Desulfatitalea alkaliphila]
MTPTELRAQIARQMFDKPTAGYCNGYVQANLVVLPKTHAADFERFCRANPKPCPLLEMVGPGTAKTSKLAPGADLTDTLPRYRVWRDGHNEQEVADIKPFYTPDMVFFLLGCSFSFEEALVKAGIRLRHVDQAKNVSMYRTNLPLVGVGPFQGEMVVSMRPIHRSQVAQACIITGRYPEVHGEPVHVGYPEMIGITDLAKPDYGDPVEIMADEIPVFWACGVTPQNVLVNARLPMAITHAPGYMFVSDIKNEAYAV